MSHSSDKKSCDLWSLQYTAKAQPYPMLSYDFDIQLIVGKTTVITRALFFEETPQVREQ